MCRQLRWKLPPSPGFPPTLPTRRPLRRTDGGQGMKLARSPFKFPQCFSPASERHAFFTKQNVPPAAAAAAAAAATMYAQTQTLHNNVACAPPAVCALLSPLSHYILTGRRIECRERYYALPISSESRSSASHSLSSLHPVREAVSLQLPVCRLFLRYDGKVSERGRRKHGRGRGRRRRHNNGQRVGSLARPPTVRSVGVSVRWVGGWLARSL